MKFSGRLQIEPDSREWIKIDLSLDHGRLELTSGNEMLGSWAMSRVRADRIEGDRFELQLGDDRALFAADDALAFSYEAMPHLVKKHAGRANGLRERFRNGLRNGDRHAADHPNGVVPAVAERERVAVPAFDVSNDSSPPPPPPRNGGPIGMRGLRELLQQGSAVELVSPGSQFADVLPDIGDPRFERPVDDQPYGRFSAAPVPVVEDADAGSDPTLFDSSATIPLDSVGHKQDALTEDWWGQSPTEVAPEPLVAEPLDRDQFLPRSIVADQGSPGQAPPVEVEPGPFAPTPRHSTDPVLRAGNGHARPSRLRHDLEPAFARVVAGSDSPPETRILTALESVLAEVRQGSMNPAQVSAVTDLVHAITDLMKVRQPSGS